MEEKIVEALERYNPASVLIYGSRGRGDHTPGSDYDVMAIFADDAPVELAAISQKINLPDVRVRPCRESEFRDGLFKTPYSRNIFIRGELAEGGRTIYGQKIVESLPKPTITTMDLIRGIRLDLGYAWATRLSGRHGDTATARKGFSKSCLFGLRYLAILKKRQFPVSYDEIYAARHGAVDNDRFLRVIEAAYKSRQDEGMVIDDHILDNIDFLMDVDDQIMNAFNANGIQDLV